MRRTRLVLGALCLQFAVIGGVAAWRDSPTVDEVVDVAAGATGVVRHDFRMLPEHGLLPRVAVGAPALVAQPVIPDGEGWRTGDWFVHAREFVAANREAGHLHAALFASRLASLALGMATGLVLFVLARRRAGDLAGVLAAGAWLTTPIVVGFAHVAMIDVPFALAVVVTALALERHRSGPTRGRAAAVGAAVGCALLCRHLGLVLVPVAAVAVAVAAAAGRERLRQALSVLLVAWAVVWGAFLLADPTPAGGAAGERIDGLVAYGQGADLPVRLTLSVPWPDGWAAGLGYLAATFEGREAYLVGQAWTGGRWWFFPASLLLRTSIPVAGLLVVSPLLARRGGPGWRDRARSSLPVAGPAVGLVAALVVQPLNLGVRVALPVLALGLVAGAEVVVGLGRRWRRPLLAAGSVIQAGSLTVALPATIAALTFGPVGPEPYRVAADIDIGQDLERWQDRARSLPDRPLAAVLTPLGMSDGSSGRLVDRPPGSVTGWVAASAAELTLIHADELAWLRAYCPVDLIGETVLVYRFDVPPDPRPGPTAPERPCTDREFSARTG